MGLSAHSLRIHFKVNGMNAMTNVSKRSLFVITSLSIFHKFWHCFLTMKSNQTRCFLGFSLWLCLSHPGWSQVAAAGPRGRLGAPLQRLRAAAAPAPSGRPRAAEARAGGSTRSRLLGEVRCPEKGSATKFVGKGAFRCPLLSTIRKISLLWVVSEV